MILLVLLTLLININLLDSKSVYLDFFLKAFQISVKNV